MFFWVLGVFDPLAGGVGGTKVDRIFFLDFRRFMVKSVCR